MLTMSQEYKNRVKFKGSNKREYVNTKVRESIDDLISNSQYGFTIKKDNIDYNVAILSTSSTQDYEKANIIAHNEVGLDRGSLFEWNDNYWIVLQKMFRPEQPGFNGYAYRCNWTLKWIDDLGVLQERHAYVRAGRITNTLTYTPDVNYKFDNILLHDTDWSMMAAIPYDPTIHEEMRFLVKGRAYRITNIDNVSIDNVSIISMVDDKLLDSDDKVNNIAGKSDYNLRCSVAQPINLYGGDIKNIPVTILYNGEIVEEELIFESYDTSIVEISNNNMVGRGIGNTKIKCSLLKNPYKYIELDISVTEQHNPDVEKVYIDGPDFINWNSSATYKLSNGNDCDFEIIWHTPVKHKDPIFTNNSVTLEIKDKYSGDIEINTVINETVISKTVHIKTV